MAGHDDNVSRSEGEDRVQPSEMFFWAVVSDEIKQVIEFFPTRRQAERMLATVLRDEPSGREILRVEKIEFRTGTVN